MKVILYIFLLCLFFEKSFSQEYLSLSNSILNKYDKLITKGSSFHTSIKPYLDSEVKKVIKFDSIYSLNKIPSPFKGKFLHKSWDRILNEHLIVIDTGKLYVTIDPLFNLEKGYEFNENKSTFINTRGLWINGKIGNKFAFSSTFYENQASFPKYLDEFIRNYNIVPGQGYVRPFKNGDKFDYSSAEAYVSFSPSDIFSFQFGHGKNFIGDGYRSLLLSDNTFNYPFFKISTNIWKLKYINLFTQFQNNHLGFILDSPFPKKHGTFHYLSMIIAKKIQIGLFEAIIWPASDNTGYRGFDINYLNPIIFFRPVEYSMASADNSLMGLNTKLKVTNTIQLYGQLILDDFNFAEFKKKNNYYQQKFGTQSGIKLFNIPLNGLDFQIEYNRVRPYSYAHKEVAQNYSHYNQPLAHPLGANFHEIINFIRYNYKRLFLEYRFSYSSIGKDSTGRHFGSNIFISDRTIIGFPNQAFNNILGQGVKTIIKYNALNLSYLINPAINMKLEVNYLYRTEASSLKNLKTSLFSIGLKTNISNTYYDF